jgi:hypothetical protein
MYYFTVHKRMKCRNTRPYGRDSTSSWASGEAATRATPTCAAPIRPVPYLCSWFGKIAPRQLSSCHHFFFEGEQRRILQEFILNFWDGGIFHVAHNSLDWVPFI